MPSAWAARITPVQTRGTSEVNLDQRSTPPGALQPVTTSVEGVNDVQPDGPGKARHSHRRLLSGLRRTSSSSATRCSPSGSASSCPSGRSCSSRASSRRRGCGALPVPGSCDRRGGRRHHAIVRSLHAGHPLRPDVPLLRGLRRQMGAGGGGASTASRQPGGGDSRGCSGEFTWAGQPLRRRSQESFRPAAGL